VLVRREKERQHPGHGHARVPHADEDFPRRRERFRYEDGGGLALFGSGEVGSLLSESEVAGTAQSAGAKPVSWTEPSPRTSPGVVLQFEQR